MALDFSGFIQEHFVRPILDKSLPGYNPINTITYIAILLAVSFFVIFPQLDKRGVKFNTKLMLAILPYIFFGSSLRIFEDLNIFQRSVNPLQPGFYIYTPGIYIFVGLLTIFCLLLSRFIAAKTKHDFHNIFGGIGIFLAISPFGFILTKVTAWPAFANVVALVSIALVLPVLIFKYLNKNLLDDNLSKLALTGQASDGIATFIALSYPNCAEQHVLSNFIITSLGAWAFPVVKIILILLILHFANDEIKGENLRNFVKCFLAILGFAPGIRDWLLVSVGVCG